VLAQNQFNSSTVSTHDLLIPENARNAFHLGLQRFKNQDFSSGVRLFREAINKFPDFYEAYYQMALAQVHLHQNDDAARSFQVAINLSAGHYPLAEFGYALFLCNRGDLTDAERLVRHGLEQNPNMPDGYIVLGVVLLRSNRIGEAEHNANEALLRNAQAFNAYLLLADVHNLRKDYSAEIRDFDAFLALEPNGPHSGNVRLLRQAAQHHTKASP
jgi:Tfp pilus assembly protein PilF